MIAKHVPKEEQIQYYEKNAWSELNNDYPDKILLSLKDDNKFIYYGAFLNISWPNSKGEVSLLSDKKRILMNRFPFQIIGFSEFVNFKVPVDSWLRYKTLISQKMLKIRFPNANSMYVYTEYTEKVIYSYFERLNLIFSTIADFENVMNVYGILYGTVCHVGFKRLN